MLYETYEIRRTARRFWGQVLDLQALDAVPLVHRTYPVRATLAATDVYNALQLTHDRPDFGVESVMSQGIDVDVTEEVSLRTPFASLVRFAKSDGSSHAQPKVLVVPGLAGHFATLVRPSGSATRPPVSSQASATPARSSIW